MSAYTQHNRELGTHVHSKWTNQHWIIIIIIIHNGIEITLVYTKAAQCSPFAMRCEHTSSLHLLLFLMMEENSQRFWINNDVHICMPTSQSHALKRQRKHNDGLCEEIFMSLSTKQCVLFIQVFRIHLASSSEGESAQWLWLRHRSASLAANTASINGIKTDTHCDGVFVWLKKMARNSASASGLPGVSEIQAIFSSQMKAMRWRWAKVFYSLYCCQELIRFRNQLLHCRWFEQSLFNIHSRAHDTSMCSIILRDQ